MTMDEYASIEIVFYADPKDLETLASEAKLSDEYTKIADDLNAWLKQRMKNSPLKFDVKVE